MIKEFKEFAVRGKHAGTWRLGFIIGGAFGKRWFPLSWRTYPHAAPWGLTHWRNQFIAVKDQTRLSALVDAMREKPPEAVTP